MSSESSITVAVRVRPFSSKEAALLPPADNYTPFMGDGGLGGSPDKIQKPIGLKHKYLRSIVSPIDERVLIFDPPDNNPLTRLCTNTFGHGARRHKDVRYAFDRIFPETTTQTAVFQDTTQPLLDGILKGYNATVFAYGATGCGKTHTISGTAEDPGVIFLTMRDLYQRVADQSDECQVDVRLSYLEIYNEMIRDLLSPEPTPAGKDLALREDASNKISVVGITEHSPENPEQVLEMITEGNRRRTMSPTEANAVSSRSHAVLQINVTQRPRAAGTMIETTSASLNIIDLAGSERASATRNNGQRMKEGANINKSLLALGNCINALCQSGGMKGRHVPYRNSKLTRLLKFSLGGNCKTVMIVCVSPSSAHYEETQNTLKYANQAKNIRTKVTRNMLNVDRHVAQYVQAIHELKEEVAELKAKLAERGQLETATEKRRRIEVSKEMDDSKQKMRESAEQVKRMIREKAGVEAMLRSAQIRRISAYDRRLEVDAEMERLRSQGFPLPADLESERVLLTQSINALDATLNDESLQAAVRGLTNSLQLQQGIMIAAAHNTKFDSDASETVKNLGTMLQAEIECLRSNVKLEKAFDELRQSQLAAQVFLTLATRCTVASKEAAGELEYWHGRLQSDGPQEGLADAIGAMAGQLRGMASANDDSFQQTLGRRTESVDNGSNHLKPPATSSIRRARQSLSPAVLPVPPKAVGGALTRRRSMAAVGVARAPIASGPLSPVRGSPRVMRASSSYAAPTAASRAQRIANASSPRRTVLSPRRVTRRQSTLATTTTAAARRVSHAQQQAAADKKKAFRWADEAGEGKIDDAGSPLKKKGSPHPLGQAPISADGWEQQQSGEDDDEEETPPPLQLDVALPKTAKLFAAAATVSKPTVAPRRTVSGQAKIVVVRQPSATSKPSGSEPRRSVRLSGEGLPSSASARVAFSDVRNVSDNVSFHIDEENPFDDREKSFDQIEEPVVGETRGTPYKRRESSGGVGPVRRARGRLSASTKDMLPASSKVPPLPALPSIFAAIAKERDELPKTTGLARPPPGNAAARAAAAASSSHDSSLSAPNSDRPLSSSLAAKRPSAAARVPLSGTRSSINIAASQSRSAPRASAAV